MSADIWFKRDLANALLATHQAMAETSCVVGGRDATREAAFHAGCRLAISTMALFFGISPAAVLGPSPVGRIGSSDTETP